MALTYHLTIAGPVPGAVVEQIQHRFGAVTIRPVGRQTELNGAVVDQAAVRALLNLLWDAGIEVRLLRITAAGPPAARRFSTPS